MTDANSSGVTLRDALSAATAELAAASSVNPRRDAELLLLHVAQMSRAELISNPDRQLTTDEWHRYRELIARRKQFEPVQYINGEREFYGLTFRVVPGVLIPRPETEHLVEAVLERIPLDAPCHIADVGTGSGAIAIALAVARPLARIAATDISVGALNIAKENAAVHGVEDRIRFREADLLANSALGEFDIVVSNPPYIADGERESLDAEVREYEPAQALFAGPTGLELYERLIPQAAEVLRPGGWLAMEIGAGQQLQLSRLLKDWSQISFASDLQGIPRVALAQRP